MIWLHMYICIEFDICNCISLYSWGCLRYIKMWSSTSNCTWRMSFSEKTRLKRRAPDSSMPLVPGLAQCHLLPQVSSEWASTYPHDAGDCSGRSGNSNGPGSQTKGRKRFPCSMTQDFEGCFLMLIYCMHVYIYIYISIYMHIHVTYIYIYLDSRFRWK